MNNENDITVEELKQLLIDNEIKDYDPVAEAFRAYDPDGTGFIDPVVLRNVFENLGFGKLTDDDMNILVSTFTDYFN